MVVEKKDEFVKLFQEFVSSYPYTPAGLRHRAAYEEQRQQGRRNLEAIAAAAESGEDVTENVLLQLLPYIDSTNNRQKRAWIHHAPCITDDLKGWFENSGWTKPEEWPLIAKEILRLVCCCKDDPSHLSAACNEFWKLPYSRAFPMEMFAPILNAIHPDRFLLIDNNSRLVINYFANTFYSNKLTDYPFYSNKLTDYPAANVTGHELIEELAREMHQLGLPALRDEDLFNMFCHWLVAIKKYDLVGKESFAVNEAIELTYNLKKVKLQLEYTLSQCAETTGFEEAELERWVRAIERKKQAILYGSPGTGKTFISEKLAQYLIGGGDGFSELVQFHPAYSYEDFIQGIRPQTQDGQLKYPLVPGRFLEFCKKAESCLGTCVLIIDEINRANLAQVFGELMYLLEYRDKKIRLAGSNDNELFGIPANVRIIGTMNTSDRSIAVVDHALRRRFAFIELFPKYEVLQKYHQKTRFQVGKLIDTLKRLNKQINNKHYEIGISFFLTDNLDKDIEDIWRMEIEPYLEEYFFNQLDKVDEFRWTKIKQQVLPL